MSNTDGTSRRMEEKWDGLERKGGVDTQFPKGRTVAVMGNVTSFSSCGEGFLVSLRKLSLPSTICFPQALLHSLLQQYTC